MADKEEIRQHEHFGLPTFEEKLVKFRDKWNIDVDAVRKVSEDMEFVKDAADNCHLSRAMVGWAHLEESLDKLLIRQEIRQDDEFYDLRREALTGIEECFKDKCACKLLK